MKMHLLFRRMSRASAAVSTIERSARSPLEIWHGSHVVVEIRRAEDKAAQRASFEESYPRYEFAALVRLALVAGAWLVKVRRVGRRPPDMSIEPLPGEMNPAE